MGKNFSVSVWDRSHPKTIRIWVPFNKSNSSWGTRRADHMSPLTWLDHSNAWCDHPYHPTARLMLPGQKTNVDIKQFVLAWHVFIMVFPQSLLRVLLLIFSYPSSLWFWMNAYPMHWSKITLVHGAIGNGQKGFMLGCSTNTPLRVSKEWPFAPSVTLVKSVG